MNKNYECIVNWGLHQKLIEEKNGKVCLNLDFNPDSFSDLERKYIISNDRFFNLNKVDVILDGGTLVLESYTGDRLKYYLDKVNYTIHTSYPTSDNNIVTDESIIYWIIKSYYDYILKLENEVQLNKNRLDKMLKK
jgi:hypothetical protein